MVKERFKEERTFLDDRGYMVCEEVRPLPPPAISEPTLEHTCMYTCMYTCTARMQLLADQHACTPSSELGAHTRSYMHVYMHIYMHAHPPALSEPTLHDDQSRRPSSAHHSPLIGRSGSSAR